MKNSTANIGARIKEIRIQKGMTQAGLCGYELTRNHLSLIESGKSLPSLKNVCYIADRLNIPVGYLFSDDENEDILFVSYHAADKIKPLYDSGDQDGCITVCRSIPENIRSDEISMIYSKALLDKAVTLADSLDMDSAIELLFEAESASAACGYLGDDFKSACKYYEALFKADMRSTIPEALCDIHAISSYVSADLVMYMRLLNGENVSYSFFRDDCHRRHAESVSLMHDGKSDEAFVILDILSDDTSLPFYMRYRVYDDLEKCASEVGEFKAAYSAAKKKLGLTER